MTTGYETILILVAAFLNFSCALGSYRAGSRMLFAPEVARTYCLKGDELLIVSTNLEKPYSDDWDLVTRARAFDNCIYLVAVNRVGRDKELGFFGHSKIIDPVGKPIKELNEEIEGSISAEIDLELPKKKRAEYYIKFHMG